MTEPTPIEEAIESVEERRSAKAVARLPIFTQPHGWTGDADITLNAVADPTAPSLMIFDEQEHAWRLVYLPPGSTWSIRPAEQRLWRPPQ